MPTQNDFLPFAASGTANVLTQAQYEALAALIADGFQSGIAESAHLNKVWRQPSIMAAVIAQYIVQQINLPVVDDGTTATILADLTASINKAITSIVQPGSAIYGVGGGVADAYTAVFTPVVTALADGMILEFEATAANTGASTFAPDALAAKPILGGAYLPLQGGEIIVGSRMRLMYHLDLLSWILLEGTGGSLQVATATQAQHATTLNQVTLAIAAAVSAAIAPTQLYYFSQI